MDKTIDFIELQELKSQFDLLKEKLEKQQIINESLIQESMKQKISYVEKYYKLLFTMYAIVSPLMAIMLVCINVHWAFIVFIMLALVVELAMYYKGYRKLNPKELMVLGYIDAIERVSKFKKQYQLVSQIMFIPAIVFFIIFILAISGYEWHLGRIIYYSIFVMIALIWEIMRKRKLFSRLDGVLRQIKELRNQ